MTEDEMFKLRERLHRLNDLVQVHEVRVKEHDIRIDIMEKQVGVLSNQTATREQLDHAVLALGSKITAAIELMSLQIKMIADDLAPLRKGIYWVVGIVLSAVLLAGLSFLLKRPPL